MLELAAELEVIETVGELKNIGTEELKISEELEDVKLIESEIVESTGTILEFKILEVLKVEVVEIAEIGNSKVVEINARVLTTVLEVAEPINAVAVLETVEVGGALKTFKTHYTFSISSTGMMQYQYLTNACILSNLLHKRTQNMYI